MLTHGEKSYLPFSLNRPSDNKKKVGNSVFLSYLLLSLGRPRVSMKKVGSLYGKSNTTMEKVITTTF
jgi:hypothetical protein